MGDAELDVVIAALPTSESEALTARKIWQRVDCWSLGWTDRALGRLVELGRAKVKQQPIPTGFQHVYWKTP